MRKEIIHDHNREGIQQLAGDHRFVLGELETATVAEKGRIQ
jgi:hypothetical protein